MVRLTITQQVLCLVEANRSLTPAVTAGCKKLIFSSSATVYGNPEKLPITEDLSLSATWLLTQGVPAGGPTGPLCTPWRTPLDPLHTGKAPFMKRARTSAGTFGSTVRPTAAHGVITMVINRLSVLVSGFGVGFGPVHTALEVDSGCFGMIQGRRFMAMVRHPRSATNPYGQTKLWLEDMMRALHHVN
jgi:hypothetical protein